MEARSDRPVVRVVAAVIWMDDRVYAAQRGYGDMKDGWEFPGGKVEKGEAPEQALRREVREELGCELGGVFYLDTVEHDYDGFHLSMDVFACTPAAGETPRSREHEAERWLSRDVASRGPRRGHEPGYELGRGVHGGAPVAATEPMPAKPWRLVSPGAGVSRPTVQLL